MEVMDREISAVWKRKQRTRLYLTIGILILPAVGGFVAFRNLIKPTIHRTAFTAAKAEMGPVEATITASGVVIPEYERLITSPITARIEQVMHNAGEEVKAGEPILQLNKEFSRLEYDKLNDEQEVNRNKGHQLRLSLQKSLNDLQTQLAVKELKIKSFQTALEDEKTLLNIGGSTPENVKQAELNLHIAQLELLQLKKLMVNQEETMQADLKSLGFQMKIQEKNIRQLDRKLQQAAIEATQNGVITWVNDKIGSSVPEGAELVRMADLSSFKIEGSISDSYAHQLKPGGAVIVRINEQDLRGKITQIQPEVENGVVKFMVSLNEKDHPLLRSNAKVDVYVVTAFRNRVVRVKNGPAFNGSAEQKIFVIGNNEALSRTIKTGESNFDFVEIKSGLRAGEEIIVSDMQEYTNQPVLRIK